MRARTYSQRVQNGPVARRKSRPRKSTSTRNFSVTRRAARAARSQSPNRQRRNRGESGTSVLWLMVFVGVLLAAGFIFSIRAQINAHNLGRDEERLKTTLDEYASHQKFLMLDHQRALNAGETGRISLQSGLVQVKLDQPHHLLKPAVHKSAAPAAKNNSANAKPARTTQSGKTSKVKKIENRKNGYDKNKRTARRSGAGADGRSQLSRADQRRR